jgi:hypothetical protein
MRCKACNVELTDRESVKRDRLSGEFLDLCSDCFIESQQALLDDIECENYHSVSLGVDIE